MTIDVKKEREFLTTFEGHTPAPWIRDCWDILGAGGGTGAVCDVAYTTEVDSQYWNPGEEEANVRLIAAAPDLKAKYEAALDALEAERAENEWLQQELKDAEDRSYSFAAKEFHTERRANKTEKENKRLRKALETVITEYRRFVGPDDSIANAAQSVARATLNQETEE